MPLVLVPENTLYPLLCYVDNIDADLIRGYTRSLVKHLRQTAPFNKLCNFDDGISQLSLMKFITENSDIIDYDPNIGFALKDGKVNIAEKRFNRQISSINTDFERRALIACINEALKDLEIAAVLELTHNSV